jgi:hypothetical protein
VSNFWNHYWYPSLTGNGPEDITSLIIIGILTGIFVPRVRRWWVAREEHMKARIEHNATLLKHVIRHHPDIPNTDRHGNLLVDLPPEVPKKAAPVKKAAVKKSAAKPPAQPKE